MKSPRGFGLLKKMPTPMILGAVWLPHPGKQRQERRGDHGAEAREPTPVGSFRLTLEPKQLGLALKRPGAKPSR